MSHPAHAKELLNVYPAFLKALESCLCLESYTGHSFESLLPLCRDTVGVFDSPNRLGHRILVSGVLPLGRDTVSPSWLGYVFFILFLFLAHEYEWFLNIHFWPVDWTLIWTTVPSRSWTGSNGNKRVTPHSTDLQNWILNNGCRLVSYTFLGNGGIVHLYRAYSQRVLSPTVKAGSSLMDQSVVSVRSILDRNSLGHLLYSRNASTIVCIVDWVTIHSQN